MTLSKGALGQPLSALCGLSVVSRLSSLKVARLLTFRLRVPRAPKFHAESERDKERENQQKLWL